MSIAFRPFADPRLAALQVAQGHYLNLGALMELVPEKMSHRLWQIVDDNSASFFEAFGSSHNHQAWKGGYFDHVTETMNIACQLYRSLNGLRRLPFELHDALVVMFLHDIEKPFKVGDKLLYKGNFTPATKDNRKQLRADIIREYEIALTPSQENALRYVEGVRDSEYTPGDRVMGELATFCHLCDLCSARLWHDKGANVPAPDWE